MTHDGPSHGRLGFLTGGGVMGELIREHDWSTSAIGEPGTWPASLQTATSVCLNSRFPMLIWWGADLVMIYNDGYIPMLGAKHPRALGGPGREAWSEIWDVIGPMLEGVLYDGRATWSEDQLLVMNRAGFDEETYFTWSYSPIMGDDGKVAGVFSAINETTVSVLGTRRLRVLAEVADRAGNHADAHSAAAAAIEALQDDPEDVPFALLYEVADGAGQLVAATGMSEPRQQELARLSAGGTGSLEAVLGAAMTEPLEIALPERAMAMPVESAPGWRLVIGIPERLVFDDDLRRFQEVLTAAVGIAIASATAIEEERLRADALAELDRAKTDFFMNVSHEFRTPLTLMLGPLEDELARRPEGDRESLELAHRNALRLLRLVNALLAFSRGEAGQTEVHVRPIDLAALTRQLGATFAPAIQRAGISFELDVDGLTTPAQADPDLWERILLNLLSNALKHTFEGTISVRAREDGDRAIVEVADTGVGIPPEHRDRVFERFHRVPGLRSRSHEGSGIGLALVSDLIAAQQGSVAVSGGQDGLGTSFTIELPLADAPAVPLPGPSALADAYVQEIMRWEQAAINAISATGGRPRVLFVDDNADMRDYVRALLAPTVDVVTVSDGDHALAVLRGEDPIDLVLSDVMMARLDGLRLLSSIRADAALSHLPVVLLSARAGPEAAVEALDAGADDYIVKPFTAPELLARVRSNLELSRSRNQEADRQREHAARMQDLYEREHRVAATLQTTMLPQHLPAEPYVTVAGRYVAAEDVAVVGGDWYDAVILDDGSLILTIGDVAGHGLMAAAAMGQLRSATRGYALRGDSPAKLLSALNRLASGLDGMPMATCLAVRIDASRRHVEVASAGHPPAFVVTRDGSAPKELRGDGPPLGVTRTSTWSTEEAELDDGSTIVLYTDGLIERRDETLDAGFARICECIQRLSDAPAQELADSLISELRLDAGWADDVAVLVCSLGPIDPAHLELELEAEPRSLAVLRRSLRHWMAAGDVEPAIAYDMLLAVDESASNAIEHAYGPGEGTVFVSASHIDGALHFEVRDTGHWREPRGVDRGRGLKTMEIVMSDVDVQRTDEGTHVRLVRRLDDVSA